MRQIILCDNISESRENKSRNLTERNRMSLAKCFGNTLGKIFKAMLSMTDDGTQWKAKTQPYKHTIAAYGATVAGLPSQIDYGGWQKNFLTFHHGGHSAAI